LRVVLRTHIKDADRLNLLDRSLHSLFTKGIDKLGSVCLLDDNSPNMEVLQMQSLYHPLDYVRTPGPNGTKEGLVKSIRHFGSIKDPVLYCVDDLVFSSKAKDVLVNLAMNDIEEIKAYIDYGLIGLFACYTEDVRAELKIKHLDYWKVPWNISYAYVCHIFSPKLQDFILKEWALVESGAIPYPKVNDDIWVAELCERKGLAILNTMKDYAQHTGMRKRSYDIKEDEYSEYVSTCFVE